MFRTRKREDAASNRKRKIKKHHKVTTNVIKASLILNRRNDFNFEHWQNHSNT